MQFLQRYAGKILRPFHIADLWRVFPNQPLKRLTVRSAGTAYLGFAIGLIDHRGTVAKDDEGLDRKGTRDPARLDQGEPFSICARSETLLAKDELLAADHYRQFHDARRRPAPSVEIDFQAR